MKKILRLTILLLILSDALYSQNVLFIGNKKYPSTDSFVLKSNKEWDGYDLNVSVAKIEESGIIVLSTNVFDCSVKISGNILIYLEDGSVITCIDRAKFDCVDGKTTTLYNLNKLEINQLKASNINTIRFSLRCADCLSSTAEGNYSASNKEIQDDYPKKEKTDVPNLIDKLFNNN